MSLQVGIESDFGAVPKTLWVVTSAWRDRRGGLLASWFYLTSIDPLVPTAVLGLGPGHFTTTLIEGSRCFAAHLLHAGQVELAYRFASTSGFETDKLAGLAVGESPVVPSVVAEGVIAEGLVAEGLVAPKLRDCLVRLDCRVYARAGVGDRVYFWADIEKRESSPLDGEFRPLTDHAFFRGLTPEQGANLRAGRERDIAGQREPAVSWRQAIPGWLN